MVDNFMNDKNFEQIQQVIANRIQRKSSNDVMDRLKDWYPTILPKLDRSKNGTIIKSDCWGWSIETCYVQSRKCVMIMAEGLATLDDAVRICEELGLGFTVADIQDPDPL